MCKSKKNDNDIVIDLPDINGSKNKRRKSKKPHSDESSKSDEEVFCVRFERSFAGYMHVSATSLPQAIKTVREWLLSVNDDDVIAEAINIHNKVEGL